LFVDVYIVTDSVRILLDTALYVETIAFQQHGTNELEKFLEAKQSIHP